jgi:hypothetical protein
MAWGLSNDGVIRIFSMVSLSFWTLDMCLSFFTGYYTEEEGLPELRLAKTAKRYMVGWFAFDVTINGLDWAGVLLEAIFSSERDSTLNGIASAGRILRSARMVRIVKVVRRMMNAIKTVRSVRMSVVIQAAQILTIVLWINHVIGCIWMGAGQAGQNLFEETWLDRAGIGGLTFKDSPISYQYFTALHWSMTQMTPGSMEVFPTNWFERAINIACLVFGLLFGTSLVSQLSAKMVQFNMSRQQEYEQLDALRRYLNLHNVSMSL